MASTTNQPSVNLPLLAQQNQDAKFSLLRLPREIRQEIFSYLLDFGFVLPSKRNPKMPFVVWWFDADGRRELQHSAPLYTCRLLYQDCLPVLRRVRLLVEDCRVVTSLVDSMDENTRAVVRSVTLARASVEKKGMWKEVCQGLKKLDLKDLQISIDSTEEVMKAIHREGNGFDGDSSSSEEEDTFDGDWSMTDNVPIRKIGWVENMLGIRGLRRLSVSIPQASLLENELRSYLKTRTSIQVV